MADLFVGLENNQKILIPTSSEARSGNPLGTILALQSNVVPYGYLTCNGVAFDEEQYPALYAMLGDNHTPVEGHTLDWNNAESITLSTSDYVVQKNGWLVGYYLFQNGLNCQLTINGAIVSTGAGASTWYSAGNVQVKVKKGDIVKISSAASAQNISLVPYKYYKVIKATSGLEETQQDYVLQSLLEADSYSTEEVATGKKWIDGKMIYRKVFSGLNFGNSTSGSTGVTLSDCDTLIDVQGFGKVNNKPIKANYSYTIENGTIIYYSSLTFGGNTVQYLAIEYTKAD